MSEEVTAPERRRASHISSGVVNITALGQDAQFDWSQAGADPKEDSQVHLIGAGNSDDEVVTGALDSAR